MAIRVSQNYVTVMRPLSGTLPANVSNSLAFDSAADLLTQFVVVASNLAFGQTAIHNFVYRTVAQPIGFGSYVGMDAEETLVQYLGFTPRQFVSTANAVFAASLLPSEQKGARTWPVQSATVVTAFAWGQSLIQANIVINEFGLVATAVAGMAEDCFNEIGFQAIVDSSDTVYERDESQHCVRQHLAFSIRNKPCVEKEFTPFVGSSDDTTYDEVNVSEPTLATGDMVLTYPFVAPTTTLAFKNPEFGNIETIQFSLIDRVTRGGDRIIFGDPKWASAEVRDFTVVNACEPLAEAFVAFVNTSLGKEIGLLDWEGRQWRGIIVAPESPITQMVSGFEIAIRFQGELAT